MPKLITEDTLRPEQDAAYLDMLSKLKDEGVPIPLRIWASAAGFDLDKAMAMMPEDNIIRKRLAQLQTGEAGAEGGDGGGGADLFSGSDMGEAPMTTPEKSEPAKPSSAEDLFEGEEKASSQPGNSPTLPPKWSFTAKAGNRNRTNPFQALSGSKADLKQVNVALNKFERGHDPYVKMMATLDPRIVADLRISKDNILVPYKD